MNNTLSLKKFNLFKKNITEYRKNLNFMYGYQGYQNKTLWYVPVTIIMMTPYFYFMILMIM